jgi:hypothetical protein
MKKLLFKYIINEFKPFEDDLIKQGVVLPDMKLRIFKNVIEDTITVFGLTNKEFKPYFKTYMLKYYKGYDHKSIWRYHLTGSTKKPVPFILKDINKLKKGLKGKNKSFVIQREILERTKWDWISKEALKIYRIQLEELEWTR